MCSAPDALRYFLLREIVFGQDGSFSFDALVQRYNADLANGLGNLASRTLTMINRYFKGEVPYPSHAARTTPADDAIAETARKTIANSRAVRPVSIFAGAGNGVGLVRRSTSTSSKTSRGHWAKSRMRTAARAWRRCFTPRRKRCELSPRWRIR